MRIAAIVLVGLAASAAAQPAPVEPQRWRLTLVEGQTIDVDVVASDAANFVVRTPDGNTYTIARSRVVGATRMDTPPPPPPPPPPAPTPPTSQPLPDQPEERPRNYIKGGLIALAASYGASAAAAAIRLSADREAAYGFVPLIGPSLWASRDGDKFGRDGYDWLSLIPTLFQLGSAYVAIDAATDPDKWNPPPKKKKVTMIPVGGRGMAGFVLGGNF